MIIFPLPQRMDPGRAAHPRVERANVTCLTATLALILAAAASGTEVTATRLDGRIVAGQLQNWDPTAVVIVTPKGPERVAADELRSLRCSTASAADATESPLPPVIELVDGTILPMEDFQRQTEMATVLLSGEIPTDMKTLTLSDRMVAAVRLQPLAADAAEQWNEIRAEKPSSDVLVRLEREGQSLDTIDGSIGNVDAQRIQFEFDDQTIHVGRAKVAGLIFYRVESSIDSKPLCVIHGRAGLRANLAKMSLVDGMLHVTTTAGAKFAWPVDDIEFADFSAGKLVFLSDLKPVGDERTPLVALPAAAKLAAGYGNARRDQSAYGGPLTLWFPGSDWHAAAGQTKTFGKGLALRSRSQRVYRLPSGYSRLLGVAGIEPATSNAGAVRLTIFGDDRPLLETEVAGDQAPLPIELDIAGVKRLKIVVDYGQNLDTGDWLNLCDVRIVK